MGLKQLQLRKDHRPSGGKSLVGQIERACRKVRILIVMVIVIAVAIAIAMVALVRCDTA